MTSLRYTVKAKDGRTYEGQLGITIRKTLDKRNPAATWEEPQLVYECLDEKGLVHRVWADELELVEAVLV